MHVYHGDIHETGLQDDCEACTEHADQPWNGLDDDMLNKLCERNWHYRFGENTEVRRQNQPRSYTEAVAMTSIQNLWERIGRILEADENGSTVTYLRRRWHLAIGFHTDFVVNSGK